MRSPVTTILELKPWRVSTIFICSAVLFCASSRMMKLSFKVRPRMNAMGATSMTARSSSFSTLSASSMSYSASYKRAQIRIHFFLQIPGQESQPLAGFDGRTRQHDAAHALVQQRRNRHGHREIRFSGTGGTDAENQIVALDRFHVAALVYGFRRQRLLAEIALPPAVHQAAQRHFGDLR